MKLPKDPSRWWRCSLVTAVLCGLSLLLLRLGCKGLEVAIGFDVWAAGVDFLVNKGKSKTFELPDSAGTWSPWWQYAAAVVGVAGTFSAGLVWIYRKLAAPIDFFLFSQFDSRVLQPIRKVTGLTPWVELEEGTIKAARERLRQAVASGGGDGRWGYARPCQPDIPEPVRLLFLLGPNCVGKTQLCMELGRELCQRDLLGDAEASTGLDARLRSAGYRAAVVARIFCWFLPAGRKNIPWDAGFVAAAGLENEAQLLARLQEWRPRRPTLMLLDDAPGDWLGKVAKVIGGQAGDYWYPVRLLAIDQLSPLRSEGPERPEHRVSLDVVRMRQADLTAVTALMRRREGLRDNAFRQLWSVDERNKVIAFCDGNPYLVALLLRKLMATPEPLATVLEKLSPIAVDEDLALVPYRDRVGHVNASRLIRDRVGELVATQDRVMRAEGFDDFEKRQSLWHALACATLAGGLSFRDAQRHFGLTLGRELVLKLGGEVREDPRGMLVFGPIRPLWVGAVFVDKVLADAGNPAVGHDILLAAWSADGAQTIKTLSVWPDPLVARLLQGLHEWPLGASAQDELVLLAHLICQRGRRPWPGVRGGSEALTMSDRLLPLFRARTATLASSERRALVERLCTLPEHLEVDMSSAIALVAELWSGLWTEKNGQREDVEPLLEWCGRFLPHFRPATMQGDDGSRGLVGALETLVEAVVHAESIRSAHDSSDRLCRLESSLARPLLHSRFAVLAQAGVRLCDELVARWPDGKAAASAWRLAAPLGPGESVADRLLALQAWQELQGVGDSGALQPCRAAAWAIEYTLSRLAEGQTFDGVELEGLVSQGPRHATDRACVLAFVRALKFIAHLLARDSEHLARNAVQRMDGIVAQNMRWAEDRDMQLARAQAWCSLAPARKDDPAGALEVLQRVEEIVAQDARWARDRDMQLERALAWAQLAGAREDDYAGTLEAVQQVDEIVAQDGRWAWDRDMQLARAQAWCSLAYECTDDRMGTLEVVQQVDEIVAQDARWACDRDMQLARARAWRHLVYECEEDRTSAWEAVQQVHEIAAQDPCWAVDRDMQLERGRAWCYFARANKDDPTGALKAVQRVDEIVAQDLRWAGDREMQYARALAWCYLASARKEDCASALQAVQRVDEIVEQDGSWAEDRGMQLVRAGARRALAEARKEDPVGTLEAVQELDEIVAQDLRWTGDYRMQFQRVLVWRVLAYARRNNRAGTLDAVQQVDEIVAKDASWVGDRDMQHERAQAWRVLAYASTDDPAGTLSAVRRVDEIVAQDARWAGDHDMQHERAQAWRSLAHARMDDLASTLEAVQKVDEIVAQGRHWAGDRDMQEERAMAWRCLAYAHHQDPANTLKAVRKVDEIVAQDRRWAGDRDMQYERARAWRHLAFARRDNPADTLEAVQQVDEIVAQDARWVGDRDMQHERAQAWSFLAYARADDRTGTLEAVQTVDEIVALDARWAGDRDMQIERVHAWRVLAASLVADPSAALSAAAVVDSIVALRAEWADDLEMRMEQIRAFSSASMSALGASGSPGLVQQAIARLAELCILPCGGISPIDAVDEARAILSQRLDAAWHLLREPRPASVLTAARRLGRT